MAPLLGFLIGAMVGLTGVGAGSLTVAALILLLGEAPASAVGTALVFTVATKVAVVPVYMGRGQVDRRVLARICAGGIPGALIGVAALQYLSVHSYQSAMLLSVGLIIAGMALYNIYRMIVSPREIAGTPRPALLPWIAVPIGAGTGFSSAGAGALGSLVLLSFTALTPAQVVGTDLAFGLVMSAIGGAFHMGVGTYNAALLLLLVPGGLAGVLVGVKLTRVIPPRLLRGILSVVLLLLGVQLCWKAFG